MVPVSAHCQHRDPPESPPESRKALQTEGAQVLRYYTLFGKEKKN